MAVEQPGGIELFSTLQEQLIATQDPRDAERAELLGAALTSEPVEQQAAISTPDLFSKVFPEISLPEEHRRQGLI